MKYFIALLTIALAAFTQAESLQAKVDALGAAPGVLEAWIDIAPVSMGKAGTLYAGKVAWVEVSNGTVSQKGIDVIVQHLGEVGQEAAYWVNDLPGPLKPVSDTKYLNGRTAGGWANLTGAAQLTAIQGFCNSVYAGAFPGASNIREFTCTAIDASTIKIGGYFDLGTTWEHQTWYVRLLDANGSVAAPYSNIEFQRVTEVPAG